MKFGLSEGMVAAAGSGGDEVFLLSPDSGDSKNFFCKENANGFTRGSISSTYCRYFRSISASSV